jgi:hypothetical protein
MLNTNVCFSCDCDPLTAVDSWMSSGKRVLSSTWAARAHHEEGHMRINPILQRSMVV